MDKDTFGGLIFVLIIIIVITYECGQAIKEEPIVMKALTTAKMLITPAEAVNLLAASPENLICTVTFIKKNGEKRVMNGRRGVKVARKGGKLKYNPVEKGLITFYDIQAQGYRMINVNTILNIKANGKEYIVRA